MRSLKQYLKETSLNIKKKLLNVDLNLTIKEEINKNKNHNESVEKVKENIQKNKLDIEYTNKKQNNFEEIDNVEQKQENNIFLKRLKNITTKGLEK